MKHAQENIYLHISQPYLATILKLKDVENGLANLFPK